MGQLRTVFQVRTPIYQMVTISRAYRPPGVPAICVYVASEKYEHTPLLCVQSFCKTLRSAVGFLQHHIQCE